MTYLLLYFNGMAAKKTEPPAPKRAPKVTSLRLDGDLHRRARHYSIENSVTLQAIVNEALDEYLKKRGA